MADISSPEVFTDTAPGNAVNAARLNNAINGASILPDFVSNKPTGTVVGTCKVLCYEPSGSRLIAPTVTTLLALTGAVTSVGLTVPTGFATTGGPVTSTGTLAITENTQAANLVKAGPTTGAAATPTYRALVVTDMTPAAVAVAALDIDWSLGFAFYKTTAANSTFTFSNVRDGQTIIVRMTNGASHTVTWPTVKWPSGVAPTQTVSGGTDIYTFVSINAVIYGSASQGHA